MNIIWQLVGGVCTAGDVNKPQIDESNRVSEESGKKR